MGDASGDASSDGNNGTLLLSPPPETYEELSQEASCQTFLAKTCEELTPR